MYTFDPFTGPSTLKWVQKDQVMEMAAYGVNLNFKAVKGKCNKNKHFLSGHKLATNQPGQ